MVLVMFGGGDVQKSMPPPLVECECGVMCSIDLPSPPRCYLKPIGNQPYTYRSSRPHRPPPLEVEACSHVRPQTVEEQRDDGSRWPVAEGGVSLLVVIEKLVVVAVWSGGCRRWWWHRQALKFPPRSNVPPPVSLLELSATCFPGGGGGGG